jgi:HAD superfamily hydrolase (TIGR01549 family)
MVSAWEDWLDAFHEYMQRCGLSMSREDFAALCDGFFSKPEPPDNGDGFTVLERRISELCESMSLQPPRELLAEAAYGVAVAWQSYVSLDPEAPMVLAELKSRVQLALISNFDHPPYVRDLLSQLELNDYFDSIVISSEAGVKKPNPRIFAPALEATGLRCDEVVYIGDTSDDVDGAIAAGIAPILIRRNDDESTVARYDFRSSSDDEDQSAISTHGVRVISRLSELLEIV